MTEGRTYLSGWSVDGGAFQVWLLVKRCLSSRRGDRPRMAPGAIARLRNVGYDESVQAPRTCSSSRAHSWRRIPRWCSRMSSIGSRQCVGL